jgi:mRNA-degrading endonuclease RelE of RelBE toxin-antitoxin system
LGSAPYILEIDELAENDLGAIRPFDRKRIIEAIEAQLPYEPTVPTRNRKMLSVQEAGFEFFPPLWELRIGDYRAFYDVDEVLKRVAVRAVRFKGPGDTTEEILR